jgi:hypothetical protein
MTYEDQEDLPPPQVVFPTALGLPHRGKIAADQRDGERPVLGRFGQRGRRQGIRSAVLPGHDRFSWAA